MVDPNLETVIGRAVAARRLGCTPDQLTRWITHGCRGVRLEAFRLGTRWKTSEEALLRFTAALDGLDGPRETDRQRERRYQAARAANAAKWGTP